MREMKDIRKDAIFGVVVGDALGLPVQFASREERDRDPVTGMRGHGVFNMPAGSWSDDSSLTLAALANLKYGYYPDDIMHNFVLWLFEGRFTPFGQAYDIGGTCMNAIERYAMAKRPDYRKCGDTAEDCNGNGSLMRIMPFCLYCYKEMKEGRMDEERAVQIIREGSAMTHAHERSQIACVLYFYLAKAIIDGTGTLNERLQDGITEGFEKLEKYGVIESELAYYDRLRDLTWFKDVPRDEISGSGYVLHALEASVWCLLNTDTYKDCELAAVNLGLDTDTTAAIAGGLAGLFYGRENIPEDWMEVIQRREWIEGLCE